MRTPNVSVLATVVAALVAIAAAPVRGQDALGAGNILDASLDRRTGGVNAPSQQEDFRGRNLLITNNVAGGRGFRGTVGYAAENDFRDDLGSNDLYGFRADSAWSNVSIVNFGQTYQRLRYGQELALLGYDRAGTAASSGDLGGARERSRELIFDTQLRLDRVSFNTGFLSDFERDSTPLAVGMVQDETGVAVVRSSSLSGVVATPTDRDTFRLGVSGLDLIRFKDDLERGRDVRPIGQPFGADYAALGTSFDEVVARGRDNANLADRDLAEPGREASRIETGLPPTLAGSMAPPDFRRIQERVAARFADLGDELSGRGTSRLAGIDAELDALRRNLSGVPDVRPDEGEDGMPAPGAPRTAGTVEEQTRRPGVAGVSPTQDGDEDEDAASALDRVGMILRHGERIEHLSSGGGTRFSELLAEAEERLRQGEYFWAERRFNRALRFTPGHPLATAGLVHSQLGGGLYLSSSLTLRSLFTQQPEMIDARYDPGLMPNRPRMLSAVSDLQARIGEGREVEANGLLLAYVGHLLEDRALIAQGLDAMAESATDDPLLPLLRTVWQRRE